MFGQVQTGTDRRRQPPVGRHQQNQPPPPCQRRQIAGEARPVGA